MDSVDSADSVNKMEGVDSIVRSIIDKFISRSVFGKQKYGTDLDRSDLSVADWIQHAQEEQMDGILYLEKLKKEIHMMGEKMKKMEADMKAVMLSTPVVGSGSVADVKTTHATAVTTNSDKLVAACFGNIKDVTSIVKTLSKNMRHTVANSLFGNEDPVPNVPKTLYYWVKDTSTNTNENGAIIVPKTANEYEHLFLLDNEEVVFAVYGLCVDVTDRVATLYESSDAQPIYPSAELLGKNTANVSKTKTLIAVEYVNNEYRFVSSAERSPLHLTYNVRKNEEVVAGAGAGAEKVQTHVFEPYKLSNSLVDFVEKNCPQFITFLLPEVCVVKHKGIQFTRDDVALYCQRFTDFTKEFEEEFRSIGSIRNRE